MSPIPPFAKNSPGDWITGDQLKLPPQTLAREETEAFLRWLFSAVARRPKRLNLREGARVARYLRELAWETPPGPLRRQIEQMAEVIWGTILTCAPFAAAGQGEVLQFLDQHAQTYLVSFNVAAVREQVRRSEPPVTSAGAVGPPHLMSPHLSASGGGNPQLADDLSERIYAAYHGLRRAGIHGARTRVAEALNTAGRKIASRTLTDSRWEPYEICERVKQYERGWREHLEDRETARAWGEWTVSKWVGLFRLRGAEGQAPKQETVEVCKRRNTGDTPHMPHRRAGRRIRIR